MEICSAIKANGAPCTLPATGPQGVCWAHDPANRERRQRMASRAAKAKGNQEIRDLKIEIKDLIARIGDPENGEDRNDATAKIQGYRVLRDYIELERRVKETDELATEIERLKREYGTA